MHQTQIVDASLVHLKELAKLRYLYLGDTNVTDEGLVDLQTLTTLRSVDLGHSQVTNQGVKNLKQALPDCKIIHIR